MGGGGKGGGGLSIPDEYQGLRESYGSNSKPTEDSVENGNGAVGKSGALRGADGFHPRYPWMEMRRNQY